MIIVQKYGGTSVGSIERIRNVAKRVIARQKEGHQIVVIVSAMAGETNRLMAFAQELGVDAGRELDVLLASGEQVSIALLAMAINEAGGDAVSFLGHQVRMLTDSSFSRARILDVDGSQLLASLKKGSIPVIAGFQGVDAEGNITTLGRGGSDTSAVAIAAGLSRYGEQSNTPLEICCEIYTDVDGVYTADPNICDSAKKIPRITFDEMMELASLGAKVLQIRSVEVANNYNIPIHVRSSFSEEEGTMVVKQDDRLEQIMVTGVSLDRDQSRVTLQDLPMTPRLQSKIFGPLGDAGVNIDVIVQNPPVDGRTSISFTVPRSTLASTLELVKPVAESVNARDVLSDDDIAKVSIVGVGMRSHAGVAKKMFETLDSESIEILMITTSEIKVSCVIPRRHGELAVRALHDAFRVGD